MLSWGLNCHPFQGIFLYFPPLGPLGYRPPGAKFTYLLLLFALPTTYFPAPERKSHIYLTI